MQDCENFGKLLVFGLLTKLIEYFQTKYHHTLPKQHIKC